MSTVFHHRRIGQLELRLISFYGGEKRGRCLHVALGNSGKDFERKQVEELRDNLRKVLKSWRIGSRVTLKIEGAKVQMRKTESLRFYDALTLWLSGEYLKPVE